MPGLWDSGCILEKPRKKDKGRVMLAKLFVSFALIGLGAYGGGLVTIPLIQHELVESRRWLEFHEMARILAVAQMTPGPIAVNAATFTGFRLSGILGAAVATAAVVLPSLSILVLLTPWAAQLQKGRGAASRFRQGLQIGVLSLIVVAVWSYGCGAIQGWRDFLIAAGAFVVLVASEGKMHPAVVILACGAVGVVVF